jgi:excisionase family DNA binding protein
MSSNTNHTESLWDAQDVAAYLKVSRSWVYKAAEEATIPCVRVGANLRFDPAVIRAWVKDQVPSQLAKQLSND